MADGVEFITSGIPAYAFGGVLLSSEETSRGGTKGQIYETIDNFFSDIFSFVCSKIVRDRLIGATWGYRVYVQYAYIFNIASVLGD